MKIRVVRLAILMAAMLGSAIPSSIDARAQTPPRKEAELVAAGYKRLNGRELDTLMTGNTGYVLYLTTQGIVKAGETVIMFWPNAKTRVALGGDRIKRTSNSWIERDFWCRESLVVNPGHNCASMYQVSSAYYVCLQPTGSCTQLVRFAPGNPENL